MFSSELDRDKELMKGEVDGWDSAGTSESGSLRDDGKLAVVGGEKQKPPDLEYLDKWSYRRV